MNTSTTSAITTTHLPETDTPVMIGTKEVAKILGCSMATARSVMSQKGFPVRMVGKNYRVELHAFYRWLGYLN